MNNNGTQKDSKNHRNEERCIREKCEVMGVKEVELLLTFQKRT